MPSQSAMNLYTIVVDADPNGWVKGKIGTTCIDKISGKEYIYISDHVWEDKAKKDFNSEMWPTNILNKPNMSTKVDKVIGKGLSTEDFTTQEKNKLESLQNADLSNLVVKESNKGLSSNDYTNEDKTKLSNINLDAKVDKVIGKGLSTEDYTTQEKSKLASLQNADLSNLVVKENNKGLSSNDYTNEDKTKLSNINLDTKVDKITGKTLSSNDYTNEDKNKLSVLQVIKSINGTSIKNNSFRTYKNATINNGVAVFHLTTDGLATGSALYSEVFIDSIQLIVNDPLASYQYGYVFSNSNKTLTVTCNKLTTANLLTGLLGQAQANGAVVRLSIEGV